MRVPKFISRGEVVVEMVALCMVFERISEAMCCSPPDASFFRDEGIMDLICVFDGRR